MRNFHFKNVQWHKNNFKLKQNKQASSWYVFGFDSLAKFSILFSLELIKCDFSRCQINFDVCESKTPFEETSSENTFNEHRMSFRLKSNFKFGVQSVVLSACENT